MKKYITTETFNNMLVAFDKVLKSKGSITDLKEAMADYTNLPTLCKYFYAKFFYRIGNFKKAAQIMDRVLMIIDEGHHEIDIEFMCFPRAFKEIYGIAGEIYAHNDQWEKALHSFQDYQLCVSRIQSIKSDGYFLSFRNYNEHTLSDLINNEITVCNPSVMNDPYDTLLLKWGEHIRQKKANRKHIAPFCDSFSSYRIRSFSRLEDTDGKEMIGNTLMWSHYAGQHQGFCIKYKFSPEFMTTTEERRTVRFRNIIYHPNSEPISISSDDMNTDIGLCTKREDWSYENEVRVIAYEPDIVGDYHPIALDKSSKIDSIYFGYKCPQKHIETIRKILSHDPEIKFYIMQSDCNNIYNLIPLKLTKEETA